MQLNSMMNGFNQELNSCITTWTTDMIDIE